MPVKGGRVFNPTTRLVLGNGGLHRTYHLPNPLMHGEKIRAASEGRKIDEMISELIEKGLDSPPAETLPEYEPSCDIDAQTGIICKKLH